MRQLTFLLRSLPVPRPLAASFLLFLLLGGVLFSLGKAGGVNGQPIAFNHSKHLQNGMTCTDCHVGAENQAHATLPALSACLMCHETALTKSAEEAKIRSLAAAGGELEWRPVTRVPAHVFFSHRRHVQLGGLQCSVCHGAMEKLTEPPRRPYREMKMDVCIDCHRSKRAGTDCNDCHR